MTTPEMANGPANTGDYATGDEPVTSAAVTVVLEVADEQVVWAVVYMDEESGHMNLLVMPDERSARYWKPFPATSPFVPAVRKRVVRFALNRRDLFGEYSGRTDCICNRPPESGEPHSPACVYAANNDRTGGDR